MRALDIKITQYRLADFLSWFKAGTLELSPYFQRRPVWKPEAKSYFLDTVIRGLPSPVIYLREHIDLKEQETVRQVVDGQQRLRTIFSYIDETLLKDFNVSRDRFTLMEVHNKDLHGKTYKDLPDVLKERILGYEFSAHVLPTSTEDRDVLQIFARLNSTGLKLLPQELRNAAWFGELKTTMYELALEQLERWRAWRVFTEDSIARMREVEMTSDLAMNIIYGLTGKSQKRLDNLYRAFDKKFVGCAAVKTRFRRVMDAIDETFGKEVAGSVFRSEVYFFSLFVLYYDLIYGLGSPLATKAPRSLPSTLASRLIAASENLRNEKVPTKVLDAVRRASADLGRRKTRLEYLKEVCGAPKGQKSG